MKMTLEDILFFGFFCGCFLALGFAFGEITMEKSFIDLQGYNEYALQRKAIQLGYAYIMKNGEFVWIERKAEK